MTTREATGARLQTTLERLTRREVTGIAAIDVAIAHEAPDYVVMLHDAKHSKQASIEQMATLVRMDGGVPDERGGVRKAVTRAQLAVAARLSTTATLRSMQFAEVELVSLYTDAVGYAESLARRALTKALGRALVRVHLLTAHLAKRTGSADDAKMLPAALGDYFAGAEARACMRCHLDRPGTSPPLERRDPHPYTYICAACHDDVLAEFPADLAVHMDRWPREVQEGSVLQHAMSRVSKLNAIGRVLHPLSGLEPELPTPAIERALIVPAMTPTPGPAPGERRGTVTIETAGPEREYVQELFSAREVWSRW